MKILYFFKRHWILTAAGVLLLFVIYKSKQRQTATGDTISKPADPTNSTVPDPADDQYLSFLNKG